MRRLYLAMLPVAVLAACSDSSQPLAPPTAPRLAATTETTTEIHPDVLFVVVPCANGGAGELVLLEGNFLTVFHSTQTPSGVTRITLHQNAQGMIGTGFDTGDIYRHGGGFTISTVTVGPGEVAHDTGWFLMLGPGPENNFTVHHVTHITVNANGGVTADVELTSVTCS